MSKLFEPEADESAPAKVIALKDVRILRHRKLRPVHPEAIDAMFLERSRARQVAESGATRHQDWTIILWDSQNMKQFAHVKGDYQRACKARDDIMDAGDYLKAWLILGKR